MWAPHGSRSLISIIWKFNIYKTIRTIRPASTESKLSLCLGILSTFFSLSFPIASHFLRIRSHSSSNLIGSAHLSLDFDSDLSSILFCRWIYKFIWWNVIGFCLGHGRRFLLLGYGSSLIRSQQGMCFYSDLYVMMRKR